MTIFSTTNSFFLSDEPTVGVDPLLRRAIWKELHKVYDETKSTIVISTHYIQVKFCDDSLFIIIIDDKIKCSSSRKLKRQAALDLWDPDESL